MRKAVFLMVIAALLTGCNTVRGFGRDMENFGHRLSNVGASEPAYESETLNESAPDQPYGE